MYLFISLYHVYCKLYKIINIYKRNSNATSKYKTMTSNRCVDQFCKANKSATELPEVLEPKKSEYKNVSIFSLDSDLI